MYPCACVYDFLFLLQCWVVFNPRDEERHIVFHLGVYIDCRWLYRVHLISERDTGVFWVVVFQVEQESVDAVEHERMWERDQQSPLTVGHTLCGAVCHEEVHGEGRRRTTTSTRSGEG